MATQDLTDGGTLLVGTPQSTIADAHAPAVAQGEEPQSSASSESAYEETATNLAVLDPVIAAEILNPEGPTTDEAMKEAMERAKFFAPAVEVPASPADTIKPEPKTPTMVADAIEQGPQDATLPKKGKKKLSTQAKMNAIAYGKGDKKTLGGVQPYIPPAEKLSSPEVRQEPTVDTEWRDDFEQLDTPRAPHLDRSDTISEQAELISTSSAVVGALSSDLQSLMRKMEKVTTTVEAVKAGNNAAFTSLSDRIRALERLLPHDASKTTPSASVVEKTPVTGLTKPVPPKTVKMTEEEIEKEIERALAGV